jgi:choline dehydrogenase-like flavoprotein
MGVAWAPTPLATLSAPRGEAHPCVYRGFCKAGCSTNAKQSILVSYLPRALRAGAEIRDLAMVGRVEVGRDGLAGGVLYHRQGRWRRQKARNVAVCGYSIETPRLLMNSACGPFPDGLANSSGLVGKCFMVHSNHAVWGEMDEEIRWYKAPPSLAVCEHWNYCDDKDFFGGYAFMSQGPLPIDHARSVVANKGLWGMDLRREMTKYNHMAGFKIVGETMPREENRVELTDEQDQYGLPIPRTIFGFCDNDKRLYEHSLDYMSVMMEAVGGKNIYKTVSTAHLMGGCRMGDDPRSSVTDADGRTWDIPNLWICDGSLMPTGGGVNPSMTIMANAARIADRIVETRAQGNRRESETGHRRAMTHA